jgi:predicted RNase H-like HicB family nuclease
MHKYWAAVCKMPTDNFVVVFPDLPDCVAFGETLRSAKEAASITLADYLDKMESCGEQIPEPSTSRALRSDPLNAGCYVFCVKAVVNAKQ